MDPDALSAFRLAIVDEVPVAASEDDVENVFAYHVATTPSPSSAPSYAPTREKDKEDRRRLSLVPPCQGGLVEFDVRCRWLAPVDNVNVTRAETWCRRTVRNQLRYSLGNGTLATAFETRGNTTALAGAIVNANATLAVVPLASIFSTAAKSSAELESQVAASVETSRRLGQGRQAAL